MKKAGLLFALVGPAGVGKNQLMKHVMAHSPVTQLPTATTRDIRDGEKEGREHFFVTHDEFSNMISRDEMLEWQEVHRRMYGMVRRVVEEALHKGQPIIADIDIYGAMTIRQRYPQQTVSVFIQPPTISSLIERMRNRGDRETEISKRLLRVPLELELAPACDYVVLNDEFDHAARTLLEIIQAELDGRTERRGTLRDAITPIPFQYAARVIPMRGDQLLCRDGEFLTTPIPINEQPAARALHAIQSALGVTPDLDHLVHGGITEDRYIPPISLEFARSPEGETILFNYLYRLDDNYSPLERWQWTPADQHPQLEFVKGLAQ
jgi:guanylate kinase